jgi:signal transduction histidine kinase
VEDLSLHILDIVDNSMAAGASEIGVSVRIEPENDLLCIRITDNGRGMDVKTLRKATDPFYSTKPGKKTGLGLPLLAQAAREAGGRLEITSEADRGTSVTATFRLSHPDRKPLGDIEETLYILQKSHPEIRFSFEYVGK